MPFSSAAEPEGVIGKEAAKESALTEAVVAAEGHVRAKYTETNDAGMYKLRFKAGRDTKSLSTPSPEPCLTKPSRQSKYKQNNRHLRSAVVHFL